MKTRNMLVRELQTRFGYTRDQMKVEDSHIVVYSDMDKSRVRMLVGALPENVEERKLDAAHDRLLRRAHKVRADYALGVVGTWGGGFRSAFHTRGRHDGALAGGLPTADGRLLPWKG